MDQSDRGIEVNIVDGECIRFERAVDLRMKRETTIFQEGSEKSLEKVR